MYQLWGFKRNSAIGWFGVLFQSYAGMDTAYFLSLLKMLQPLESEIILVRPLSDTLLSV